MTQAESIYEFGKWVETKTIDIIRDKYGLREFKQTDDMYSRIDGIIFHNNKLTPIQVKTRSPRIYFKDISISLKQFEVYRNIAKLNGKYICFMICDTYNPALEFDYAVYVFDFGTIKQIGGKTTGGDGVERVYFKMSDMKKLDILPIEFQKELERKHIELIRPHIDKQYISACKTKFKENE